MPQFFQDNIPLLQRDTGTQISMPATYNGQLARARVAGQGYRWSSALACNLATTGLGGLDTGSLAANTLYHVYLCVSSNIVGLVVSANGPSTGPTGFSQNRYVGRLRTQSGSANVAELAVVNVIVGSGDEIPMPIVGTFETTSSFTVLGTVSNPTPGAGTTYYRQTVREGEWAIIRYEIRQTVAGTAGSGSYLLPLPSGLTIDYSRVNSLSTLYTSLGNVGFGTMLSGSTFLYAAAQVNNSGAYANRIFVGLSNDTVTPAEWSSTTAAFTNATTTLSITARVPITEWQGLFS